MTLRQASGLLTVATRGGSFEDVTQPIADWLDGQSVDEGLLTIFLQHTSASLIIQENADPDVLRDLQDRLAHLAPEGAAYRHGAEGPDDMPAHIKTALTGTSLQIPVLNGTLRLGTWQGIYVAEHRAAAHQRSLALHFLGT